MVCKWCEKKIEKNNKTKVFYGFNYHEKCFSKIKGNYKPDTFGEFKSNFWFIMDKHDLFNQED